MCCAVPNRAEQIMEERRRIGRHPTLKPGKINVSLASSINCGVRNLSPGGACLDVASQKGIPDDFVLVVESDHVWQRCRVIWRTATRLGVEFAA
jgi:hypothetical protein